MSRLPPPFNAKNAKPVGWAGGGEELLLISESPHPNPAPRLGGERESRTVSSCSLIIDRQFKT